MYTRPTASSTRSSYAWTGDRTRDLQIICIWRSPIELSRPIEKIKANPTIDIELTKHLFFFWTKRFHYYCLIILFLSNRFERCNLVKVKYVFVYEIGIPCTSLLRRIRGKKGNFITIYLRLRHVIHLINKFGHLSKWKIMVELLKKSAKYEHIFEKHHALKFLI